MIRLENVNKYFNKRKNNEIHVINNTSLELADTGLVAFLGNSGCGKTTLLNAIGGLDKINSGRIFVDGREISRGSSNKKDNIRNANIGYIFQNYNLIEDATVFENVALVLRMIGIKNKAEIENRVMYILKRVGIERYKNRPAKMLSGGERQRVGIARAIVKNPKIVIADEPTGNLDSRNTIEIMNIIKAISRERLVILVTHEKEIAEFYASRIVRIVDGKVVSDEENIHDEELDYRMDNKIYLRDLDNQQTLESDDVKVKYYSDNSIDAEKLEIKVVVKNGNIYIERPEGVPEGFDGIELVDDHYKKLSKDVYEEYDFDYDKLLNSSFKPKYTSIYNPVSMMVKGYKKVLGYSVIKKILLLGFVLAAIISTYSASNMAGVLNITDDKFVTINKQYLTVNTGKLTPKKYKKYANMDGMQYVLPGGSNISMELPMDDYYQTNGMKCGINGSLSSRNLIDEEKLIAGTLPNKKKHIVIDKIVADKLFEEKTICMIGIDTYDELVGRTLKLPGLGDFTLVGVVDQGSPSIYAKESYMWDMLMAAQNVEVDSEEEYDFAEESEPSQEGSVKFADWTLAKKGKDIEVVKGEAPEKDYEVMLPASLESWEVYVGGEIDKTINGHKLTVSGFYKSKREDQSYYVNRKMARYDYMKSQKTVTLCPVDKEAAFRKISAENIKITDNYANDRKTYVKSIKREIIATILVGIIVLLISLIEMYLMLRSSFLSRIKEVGVLRAIGLKKRDIYKMFFGEVFALTTLTAIPGVALMAYVMESISKAPYVGEQYFMSIPLALLIFAVILVFNLLAGLLPVFLTMRKTPAQILARNDVN